MRDTPSLLVVGRPMDLIAPTTLIQAKLTTAASPPTLLPRLRLRDKLAGEARRKLSLLVAPAGYGKTTLLAEWLTGCAGQIEDDRGQSEYQQSIGLAITPVQSALVAWLTLDADDNDPRRFWTYISAALQPSHQEFVAALRPLLETAPLPDDEIVAAITNTLAADERGLILVLDDYHTIVNQGIHASISALLEHLPPTVHLVIASRSAPPLPLALLRARNQITEIAAHELRFTADEVADLVNGKLHLGLAADDLRLLEERSEGWVAGIHLVALALSSAPPSRWRDTAQQRSALLRQIGGSHHYLADYFFEEVFARQSPEVQRFLLQTSLLDRLSAPLCDWIVDEGRGTRGERERWDTATQSAAGLSMQEVLERADLFLVPLDSERRIYRYHRLFGEMLHDRLARTDASLLPRIHRRAADWYERHGQCTPAVEHALAAGELDRAAVLAARSARTLLLRGELRTLRRWLTTLGEERVRSRPRLALTYSWTQLLAGDLISAERWLQSAQGVLDHEELNERVTFAYELMAVGAMAAALGGDLEGAERTVRHALAELQSDELHVRSLLTLDLSLITLLRGDLAGANRIFLEAVRIGRAAGNIFVALAALVKLAERHAQEGHLGRARTLYEQAIQLAVDEVGQPLPIAGAAYIGLGDLLREQNDLDGAEAAISNGLKLGRELDDYAPFEGYLALARLHGARGDLAAAQGVLWKVGQLTASSSCPPDAALVAAEEALLLVSAGDLPAAARWLRGRVPVLPIEGLHALHSQRSRTVAGSAAARVLLAEGRYAEALPLLGALLKEAERAHRLSDVVALLAFEALAHRALGDRATALMALARALALAAPAGFVRTLLDLGPPLLELLREARQLALVGSPLAPALTLPYIERLLAAATQGTEAAPASALAPPAPALPAPTRELLSERELTILRRVANGLSNSAIAAELVVAPSTVKTHIKNIFTKLEVHNRVQALARAQQLGLLV